MNTPGWASRLSRYGLALILPATTLALRLYLGDAFGDRPLLVAFLLPIIICAFIGGQGPGLLATIVTALEVNLFLMSPRLKLQLSSVDAVHWLVLVLNGVLVSLLAGALHQARRSGEGTEQMILSRARSRRLGPLPLELSRTERMLVALAMPFLACAVQWVFWGQLKPFIWFLFYPAVFLSAWVGGFAGAMSSGLIASLLAIVCFYLPAMSPDKGSVDYLPSVLVFLGMAALFGRIHDRLAASEQRVVEHLETERRLKEDAPKSQGELLARMSRVAKVGGWAFDVISGEGVWTDEAARIYDLDPAVPVNVGMGLAYLLPASRAQLEQALADAVALARPFDLELELESAKGLRKWVRSQGSPVVEQGRVVRIIGALQDVTDRKRVEDQLRSSEKMFNLAFAQNPAAIALSRLEDGIFLDVNATWETLTGHSREEAIGRSARTMGIWPTTGGGQRFVQQLRDHGVVRGWEQAFLTKNGDTFVAELAAQLLTIRGEAYILSTLVDITQRCRAEAELQASRAKLEAALASMTDAVFISDQEGRFIEFNEAFATFHKFRSKADCARTLAEYPEILDVFLPDGSPAPFDQWAVSRALRGETASNAEYALRRKDTGESWVGSYSFAPIRDEHGAIVGSVVAGRDITEQKRTQDEIERLNASLEQRVAERTAELTAANAELDAFAYAVSHDLRAPLRAMNGFSQALMEDHGEDLPSQAAAYLRQIQVGSERMGALIDGLLHLSRSTQGAMERRGVDLSRMAEEVRKELEESEPGRGVKWQIQPGLKARGDARMLLVVLRNLLGNAWKYTARQAAPEIRLDVIQHDGLRCFRVVDNGAGFDMAHATKLFQPFQRLHRQDEFPGIGIGLATVQRIVRRHGGEISAHSEPGRGATFLFTLSGAHPREANP